MSGMPMTQKQWIKLLEDAGGAKGTGGKHQVRMTKPGHRPITLPANKREAYGKRFESALRRQAEL